MRECEATGKNIEQAIQNALLELKASREDVDIKILNEGGFLKKAKVKVSISEDALEKYEKKEKLKKQLAQVENETADEDFAGAFVKTKVQKAENQEVKSEPAKKVEKKTKIVADDEYVKPEAKAETAEVKEPRKERIERKFTAQEFVDGVLNALELTGTLEKQDNDVVDYYSLTGENLNDLIGHHGDCLNALSYIMSLVVKNENSKKIVLDVENYRNKREESLKALAKRTADKVAKTKRYFKFEPMSASERRILHLALQDDERVTTMSKGTEPHRYLMVFPKDYEDR